MNTATEQKLRDYVKQHSLQIQRDDLLLLEEMIKNEFTPEFGNYRDQEAVDMGRCPNESLSFSKADYAVWKTSHGWTEAFRIGGKLRNHKVFPTLSDYLEFYKSGRTICNYKVLNKYNPFSLDEPEVQERVVAIISTVVGILVVKNSEGKYELPKVSAIDVHEGIEKHRSEIKHLQDAEVTLYPIGVKLRRHSVVRGEYIERPKKGKGDWLLVSPYVLSEYLGKVDLGIISDMDNWVSSKRQDLHMVRFMQMNGFKVLYHPDDEVYESKQYPNIPDNPVRYQKGNEFIYEEGEQYVNTQTGIFSNLFEAAMGHIYNEKTKKRREKEKEHREMLARKMRDLQSKGIVVKKTASLYGEECWGYDIDGKREGDGFSCANAAISDIEKKGLADA